MKGLIALFKFTTRLPLGNSSNFTEDGVGKSMKFFPLVGIILGLIMYTAHTLLSLYINSSLVIAAIIVVIYVILTGALHLDGLSDTFDGIFSYRSKQRMLEIMKDSRVGANGVIVLVLYFILNIIFLADLESIELPMGAFILLYPVIGRMNTVINCATAPYARTSGMAKDFVEQTDYKGFLISFLITMGYAYAVLTYFKLDISIIAIVPIMAILGYYFARLMTRKIGGVTGDTLGAVLELTQVVMLFLLYFIA
ncbi:MAG: adenosylcobinamide-GDP ribazoletransferase [Fusobacteriaceae bacterium]|jgi:adenosylcobinamide-GDP ribazoletransferase|nr:adenosylcobinamide-GDP ribazoletransferase [Fusobacteriaceae bacterium]